MSKKNCCHHHFFCCRPSPSGSDWVTVAVMDITYSTNRPEANILTYNSQSQNMARMPSVGTLIHSSKRNHGRLLELFKKLDRVPSAFAPLHRCESCQINVESALVAAILTSCLAAWLLVLPRSAHTPLRRTTFTLAAISPPFSMVGSVDAIRQVGKERSALLNRLRHALETDNDVAALDLARKYCGLATEEGQ